MGEFGLIFLLAATSNGVDPELLSAVCFVESSHRPHIYVAQDGGSPSYGLCQIKESTARDMGFKKHSSFLLDPKTNAYYAAKYLAWQKKRWGSWEKAVSAYNCGRPCGNDEYVDKVMTLAGDAK
jgi:soluble lytic murein transglycosylase-like protein